MRCFHERIYHARCVVGDAQADPTELALWEPVLVCQPSPGFPAVIGHVETAAWAARLEKPGPAPMLPHRGEELVGIRWIHDQVGGASPLVHMQDVYPGPASVGGLENAALVPVSPRGPKHGQVRDVGIRRMQDDTVNSFRALQTQVLPRAARVQALVDAVSDACTVARITFPRSDPHDVWVCLKDRHRPDGRGWLVVKHRLPGEPAVGRLPDTSRCGSDVDHVRVACHGIHCRNAPAHSRRTDAASFHGGESRWIHLRNSAGGADAEQKH